MFNKTTVVNPTQYVPSTVVNHEYRAPTDESVKLLMEMEDKARGKIIEASEVRNNDLNVLWYVFDDPTELYFQIRCKIKFNGNEHIFKREIYKSEYRSQPKPFSHYIREIVIDELSKLVTIELFDTQAQKLVPLLRY